MLKNLRQFGLSGERRAIAFMKRKGYKLIEKNFNCPYGEIDIIMLKDDTLIFVEVKRRSTRQFGMGYEAVNNVKMEKLRRCAMHYIQINNVELLCRFDVISIDKAEKGEVITHIESAF